MKINPVALVLKHGLLSVQKSVRVDRGQWARQEIERQQDRRYAQKTGYSQCRAKLDFHILHALLLNILIPVQSYLLFFETVFTLFLLNII